MIKNATIVTWLIVTDKVTSRLAWDQGYYILYFFTYKQKKKKSAAVTEFMVILH